MIHSKEKAPDRGTKGLAENNLFSGETKVSEPHAATIITMDVFKSAKRSIQ